MLIYIGILNQKVDINNYSISFSTWFHDIFILCTLFYNASERFETSKILPNI